jgi:hypothetical protein
MKQLFGILVIIGTLTSTGCTNTDKQIRPYINKHDGDQLDTLTYVLDTKTGLCFAKQISLVSYMYKTTSIACVPCDSLRKIHMDTLK